MGSGNTFSHSNVRKLSRQASINEKILHSRDFFISILSDGIRTGKACLPVGKGRETEVFCSG